MTDFTGQSIGRYHIIEKLGEGGMAVVYRAHDTRLDRDVAIKFIRTDMFPPAMLQNVLQRFEREAKALARMDHPNIVHVHDYGEYEGAPYLVMEYLSGGTLRQRMGKPLPYQEAVALLAPIASALDYAHKENVVHRDVKPANILFTGKGVPKLSDFGIAKLLGVDENTTLTGTGMGMGTPAYMAPEQWSGITSPAVDQYAIGVILYELLTGRLPYQADTPAKLLVQVLTQPIPDARSYASNLPESSIVILNKSLAKTPEERYSDMAIFSTALLDLSTSSSIPQPEVEQTQFHPSRKIATQVSLPGSDLTFQDEPGTKALHRKTSQSRRLPWWLWLAGGIAMIGLVMFGTILRMQGSTLISNMQVPTPTETVPPDASETPESRQFASPTPRPTGTPTKSTLSKATSTTRPSVTPAFTNTPKLGIGSSRIAETDGMVQAYIPAGSFKMGSTAGYINKDEQPIHTVTLDAFWMDTTEVTNAQYSLCIQAGRCEPPKESGSYTRDSYYGNPEYENYPVIYVTWENALAYCTWVGRKLPSEAQWEFAARGGLESKKYPWGDEYPVCTVGVPNGAQFSSCENRDTTSVASFTKNGYGLYDMAGNAWEWTSSLYKPYPYNEADGREDLQTGGLRVLRGGAWFTNFNYLRASERNENAQPNWYMGFGFRCASSP